MKQLAATRGATARSRSPTSKSRRSNSPTRCYIAAQARERLGFVMPGDIPYQVQLPPGAALPGAPAAAAREANSGDPWYTSLWHTIADAPHGVSPTAPPAPARSAPGAPPNPLRRPARRRPVVEQADLDAVARQLGREPRGVLEIAYRCPNGEPGVVKTAPRLPDGTPFPTLYYLTHPALTAAASRLESSGLMRDDDRSAAPGSASWPRPTVAHTSPIWPSAMRSNRWARRSPAAACPTGSSVCMC